MEEKDREEELKGGTGWYADVPDIVFVIDHVPGVIQPAREARGPEGPARWER